MERSGRVVPGRNRSGSSEKKPAQADLKSEKQPVDDRDQAKVERENTEKKTEIGEQSTQEKFFAAVKRGDLNAVKELLDKRVPVDCRDNEERTALMVASESGHVEMVKLLLDRGADVNAVDIDGETAAITATFADQLDVLKIHRSHGVDLEIRNKQGRTAWDVAKDGGATDIASYIEEQLSGGQDGLMNEAPIDPDDDEPDPDDATGSSATGAMPPRDEPESAVTKGDRSDSAPASTGAARATAFGPYLSPEQEAVADEIAASLAPKSAILEANEERIEFDALDNKQVRSICEKVVQVLDKAGFEVGDYVIDTVFKGSYIAVLRPRSPENKRWRKLKKHPSWVIDPKRLTELAGACAVRRYCLAEGKEVASFTISHFIELYYVKDLKLILTLAEKARANNYTVRQLKEAADDLREHKDDHDPGKEIIKTLDQPVPIMEDPDLMALCKDKDRVLEELSKAERIRIRALIKERKPGLDEWKNLIETFEVILSDLEDE